MKKLCSKNNYCETLHMMGVEMGKSLIDNAESDLFDTLDSKRSGSLKES